MEYTSRPTWDGVDLEWPRTWEVEMEGALDKIGSGSQNDIHMQGINEEMNKGCDRSMGQWSLGGGGKSKLVWRIDVVLLQIKAWGAEACRGLIC